ncbi:hypothetical protein AKI39_07535 [Bordetella sp. H567]|uniref:protealysin inhibitor emfourin n=1 Tax=Bordetella sp. H567 TaxID=1697043 RepID=UPI00081D2B5D|nr:protealysin inhibitor emfourin [Bordetella sp. H567]AOB30569.1 hypothetical protein AKI39_07535 [Bordetella sp. H567]
MTTLPPWETVVAVLVKRQGGVAGVPALARPRTISLRHFPQDERGRLCAAITQAAAMAAEECGSGDQRYFTIEILQDGEVEPLRFSVPEAAAPEPLVSLWRDGRT